MTALNDSIEQIIELYGEGRLDEDALMQAYGAIVPGLYVNGGLNPYFGGEFPTPVQMLGLRSHLDNEPVGGVHQLLYGGAAGGGKSSWLLQCAAQYLHVPDFSAIIFRRTTTQLNEPGSILNRAKQWWLDKPGVSFNGTTNVFRFPSGAQVSFAYMQKNDDVYQYQGPEYQLIEWDELTQIPTDFPYTYLLSRLRRSAFSDIPLRCHAASNPGGFGHLWVSEHFDVDPTDPGGFPFMPARVQDNPHLDVDNYVANLSHNMSPTLLAQLLDGDWSARDPGDYCRREWFGELLDPETDRWPDHDCRRVRWWDLAASEKDGAAHTAGTLMARHRSGVYAVEDNENFQATPGKRDARIIETARTDGPGVICGLELEPGSGGVAQVHAIEATLREHGIRVVYARPTSQMSEREQPYVMKNVSNMSAKELRMSVVTRELETGYIHRGESDRYDDRDRELIGWGCMAGKPIEMQTGGIRLFRGPWNKHYLGVLESFPGDKAVGQNGILVDDVDATSGAYAWLRANPLGISSVPKTRKTEVLSVDELHNLNPAERPKVEQGTDRGGRWRP